MKQRMTNCTKYIKINLLDFFEKDISPLRID